LQSSTSARKVLIHTGKLLKYYYVGLAELTLRSTFRFSACEFPMEEKHASIELAVDEVSPRSSTSLPQWEKPDVPVPSPVKEQLITALWILLNTVATLGLIFCTKR